MRGICPIDPAGADATRPRILLFLAVAKITRKLHGTPRLMYLKHVAGRPARRLLLLFFLCPFTAGGAEVDDSLKVVSKTNRSASASQAKIDQLSRETRDLLEEYRKLQDGSDYEASYTRELEELDRSQQERIAALQQEIATAKIGSWFSHIGDRRRKTSANSVLKTSKSLQLGESTPTNKHLSIVRR